MIAGVEGEDAGVWKLFEEVGKEGGEGQTGRASAMVSDDEGTVR